MFIYLSLNFLFILIVYLFIYFSISFFRRQKNFRQNFRKGVLFFSQHYLLVASSRKSNYKKINTFTSCVYWLFIVVYFYEIWRQIMYFILCKKKSIYLRQNQNKEKEICLEFVATVVKVFPGKFQLRLLVLPENQLLLK